MSNNPNSGDEMLQSIPVTEESTPPTAQETPIPANAVSDAPAEPQTTPETQPEAAPDPAADPVAEAGQGDADLTPSVPATDVTGEEVPAIDPAADESHAQADSATEVVSVMPTEGTPDTTTDSAADQSGNAAPGESAPREDMQTLLDEAGDQANGDQSGLRKGDLIEGTVTSTSPTEVRIDIGQKTEAVVNGKELERLSPEMLQSLEIGTKVKGVVLTPSNQDGLTVLSLSRAQEEQDWHEAERLRESKEIYNGKIDGYNRGGLIVRFGRLRGFVPESHVSRDRRRRADGVADPQQKWGQMRNEDISVRVLEVDRGRDRLIMSEREAVPALRDGQKQRLLEELKIGDKRTGVVKSVADFGAFVDVGGADGLVHITEISHRHFNRPQDVLKPGQEVNVEVISVDPERKRIGLSIKRTEADPWEEIVEKYSVGQLVEGTITKIAKFGAFARLKDNPEIEGLIHLSELSDQRVEAPGDVVNEGEEYTLRIVRIDKEQRRIALSIKKVMDRGFTEFDTRKATGQDVAGFEASSLREDGRRGGGASSGSAGGGERYGSGGDRPERGGGGPGARGGGRRPETKGRGGRRRDEYGNDED